MKEGERKALWVCESEKGQDAVWKKIKILRILPKKAGKR